MPEELETHSGSVTLSRLSRHQSDTVAITLRPLTGDRPLVLNPGELHCDRHAAARHSVRIAGTVQLVVRPSPTGMELRRREPSAGPRRTPASPRWMQQAWSPEPAWATTKIAATYHGATGTATIDVTP